MLGWPFGRRKAAFLYINRCIESGLNFHQEGSVNPTQLTNWISRVGATIRIGEYACYNSEHDIIFMPSKFDPLMYKNHTYATVLLHELGHWTGHESRLCRPYFDSGKRSFLEQGGNSELIRLYYAEEEIVAELTAAQLALEFGIYWSAANSAEYLSQYLNQTDKPLKHFFQDAHRAVNYLKRWKY